ncbi:hypothetical protein HanRHA438_Chr16g0745171 [Helianthus annuus]|nr:hypothetical protein HanRHA438_Chr16g0745171 [Helianthus annuus]
MQFLQTTSPLTFIPDSVVDMFELTWSLDSETDLESTSSALAASTLSAIFPRFSAFNSCVVSMIPVSTFFDFSSSSFSFPHHFFCR